MPVNWLRLLPDEDYRFQMGLKPGNAGQFFAPTDDSAGLLAMRAALLESAPERYLLDRPASSALQALSLWCGEQLDDAMTAGRRCEADWVLLTPDAAGDFHVTAGAVCFPSSWSLPQKAGLRLTEVHAPVPGLNDSLARSIDTFLTKLAPGAAWERENWGLSADGALDHHPDHALPALAGAASLTDTWLRLERQILLRLSGGDILFGIRVTTHRLDALTREPAIAARLARALETMPEAVAVYKGVATARSGLAAKLRALR